MNDDEAKIAKMGMEVVLRPVTDIASDLLGLAGGDWLRETREKNRRRLQEKAAKELRDRKAEPVEPSPSVAIPLLSAAQDETREELLDIWAKLLAASADKSRERLFRREYIEVVHKLEPLDTVTLKDLESAAADDDRSTADYFVENHVLERSEVLVSLRNLLQLGLARTQLKNQADDYELAEWVEISPLGKELIRILC